MLAINPATAQRHRVWAVMAALFAGVMAVWLPNLELALQFWVIVIPVALFGLAHGGADPVIINALKAVRGRSSVQWLAGYIALMVLTVAFIVWQPTLALVGFLGLSIWHFAITDCMFLPKGGHAGVGWLSGSLPIIGPLAGHPEQVAVLFAWLLQQDPAAVMALVLPAGRLLILGWAVALIGVIALNSRVNRSVLLLELCALAAPMLLLPPLLAFAFYFCVVHSLRHFLLLLGAGRQAFKAIDVKILARRAAPATAGAIVLGGIIWWAMNSGAANLEGAWLADAVRVIFWGLAVLTVPHALLVALWIAPKPVANH
ncbi:Brp/Blh family beta-carotene 15,15'-dioxygenase [Halovibrio sp. HP20-50]|uniref:Brp/Blh family beta-carotene 15,15'-dioxygenase n=1 Tax=Halovibrio sp. HP20-59 TaxID=3080275 RepID=UPI00294AA37F|nr:Brp/Blh family beta-carotene 15,15'-dioxygenase [Halovibrio sp. HP20-59]MEA2117515.1 Brp/Blh family beta-carotene 15,15'-dioxygenase [Halovibrio sp. HP20-59]